MLRATLVGGVLVWLLTAPTLTLPAQVGRIDTNDGRHGIWNVAWVARTLTTQPRRLLDANIFHPHTGTLAYSEMNLVAGALAVPWYVLTGEPLAATNGAIAVALVLAFVLMAGLVRGLSGSEAAGLVAATAFTFCPYVSARTAHVQLLMILGFPLVMLAFHRTAAQPSVPRGVVLGASLAFSALACGYYGIFAGLMLAVAGLVAARLDRRYWTALLAAVATSAILLGPVYVAFVRARAASGVPPLRWLPEHAREYSANLSAYLASGAFAHSWWLDALAGVQMWKDVLFPGIGVVLLAAMGVRAAWCTPHRRVVLIYGLLAVTSFWASFGPDAGLYRLIYLLVPGTALIRAPARFAIVVTFALSVLAGFAVARFEHRWRWLPALIVCLLVAELGVRTPQWGWPSWPLHVRPPLTAADRYLARLPTGVVLEFPFPYVRNDLHNHARAMFWSTYHWHPLVNGYSDLIPADFTDMAVQIRNFPDGTTFELARQRHVRYVLWRIDRYDEASRRVLQQRIEAWSSCLMPLVVEPDGWLYQVIRWPADTSPGSCSSTLPASDVDRRAGEREEHDQHGADEGQRQG